MTDASDLPYGWERALDCKGDVYYINHVNKTTTYSAPSVCETREEEPPPSPREVTLQRSSRLGFGFVAGSEKPVVVRFVTEGGPSVGKLEPGDQILLVNGEDVKNAPRDHVIHLVRSCENSVNLTVCQPASSCAAGRKSTLLSANKKAKLKNHPNRVRFAESVCVNGSPLFPPSAFSLGDLCIPPMANVLKVFLENGQTKSFKYDTTTTVQDVVVSLKDKLCLTAGEHFSLVIEHVKSLRRNKLTLLDPKECLARIAARPGAHKLRCLFRVTFVPQSAADLAQKDLSSFDYLYLQCCNDVAQERFSPELQPEVALRLAALHMHQHALANNMSAAKLTVKAVEREFGLERFVPCGLLETMKRKELRRLIGHFIKLNSQMTGNQNKQLTQLQAKLHYLDIISSLPSYGAKCFSSNQPERVLLVSPRFGLSQIVGIRSSVPQSIANIDELVGIRLNREDELSYNVTIFLQRDRVLSFSMEDRDGVELALVLAGYYHLNTKEELNIDQEREPMTEEIAPPYLSQHNVVPAKWSYINPAVANMIKTKSHYAIFNMPPPYHCTTKPGQNGLDTNMNSNMANRNVSKSANSSPLIGYAKSPQILGHNVHFKKCKFNDDMKLFDDNETTVWFDDGMGFDLQSVLSMETLDHSKIVEARNEEILKSVTEMQKLVENSEQYLNEQGELLYKNNSPNTQTKPTREWLESDTESNNSKMSSLDDTPGTLKHSDSLLLLTETINHELHGINNGLKTILPLNVNGGDSSANLRQSQGLSAILNNCGLTDALLALGNDISQSESDNDSLYTPTNSPIHRHQVRTQNSQNKVLRTSFGLHSPDNAYSVEPSASRDQNLKEYLKQLRETKTNGIPISSNSDLVTNSYQEELVETDPELIDLTLLPPPQTPDELDCVSQVPHVIPHVPLSFADDHDTPQASDSSSDSSASMRASSNHRHDLERFLAQVTIQPPTVKITPAVELTPEEIMSYIIPPPPDSKPQALYSNQTEINSVAKSNGDVIKGRVNEIRNMFNAKNISDARNSLLLHNGTKPKTVDVSNKRRNSYSNERIGTGYVIEYPTVERKSVFSCCGKENKKSDSDSEIQPPPRERQSDPQPPERPPKSVQIVAPRPRSNSFNCPHKELSLLDTSHYNTFNDKKMNYKLVCEFNDGGSDPPRLPPKGNIPPHLLLPPKKPPLPPVPSIDIQKLKTVQKPPILKNSPDHQRLASIGSPHLQRNLNLYRNIENEHKTCGDDGLGQMNGHTEAYVRNSCILHGGSMTLQPKHQRSHSETKPGIFKNGDSSMAFTLCSPQMNRKFPMNDTVNGGRRRETKEPGSPRSQQHVRFKDEPNSPLTLEEVVARENGRVSSVEMLLMKADTAADGLLHRLQRAAELCAEQHLKGGGDDIDDHKFQTAREELTACAVELVSASRNLVGALAAHHSSGSQDGSPNAASALACCVAPLRRLADLSQALGRHTSSPLQTRNLVLRVRDVVAAFRCLAGAQTAQLLSPAAKGAPAGNSVDAQLALRAESLAGVLATLLRSLRVFSP